MSGLPDNSRVDHDSLFTGCEMSFIEDAAMTIARLETQIERLESLEFQAGIGGGGWVLIEDSGHIASNGNYTFSNIPQTYLHLVAICYMRVNSTFQDNDVQFDVNGNGFENLSYHYNLYYWDNFSQFCESRNNRFHIGRVRAGSLTAPADNVFTASLSLIPYYARTDRYPTMTTRWGAHNTDATSGVGPYSKGGLTCACLRSNTNITSLGIRVGIALYNFLAGSRFMLYGIGGA